MWWCLKGKILNDGRDRHGKIVPLPKKTIRNRCGRETAASQIDVRSDLCQADHFSLGPVGCPGWRALNRADNNARSWRFPIFVHVVTKRIPWRFCFRDTNKLLASKPRDQYVWPCRWGKRAKMDEIGQWECSFKKTDYGENSSWNRCIISNTGFFI